MAVKIEDILPYNFFQYGSPFIGECKGMHFRIARSPLENVVFNHDPHKNDEALFDVCVWRGPFNYEKTDQEKIQITFPFTEEGRLQAIDWINERYLERVDFWAEGIPLFSRYQTF